MYTINNIHKERIINNDIKINNIKRTAIFKLQSTFINDDDFVLFEKGTPKKGTSKRVHLKGYILEQYIEKNT